MARGRWIGLAFALCFDLWLRGHTFGPSIRETIGFAPYLTTGALSEPLDCDEAIYAYMGKRIVGGAVLYRDLTENKPPLGYWIYAGAVAIGGMNELTIRLMPIPFVLATVALVWWIGLKLKGPWTAFLAAITYAVISTDPYVFGNSANMEFMINAFAVGSLALVISARTRGTQNQPNTREVDDLPVLKDVRRWKFFAAGLFLGMAALVKQVAALHGAIYAVVLLLPDSSLERKAFRRRLIDILALSLGFLVSIVIAVSILWVQGAGASAYDDIIRFGAAMATDTPPPANAPSKFIRWFTGNADPNGRLPWPFGATDYLVWWGTGTWPIWLAAIPSVGWALFAKSSTRETRLVALWTLSAWVQVGLPGLFWQHYYLLPLPGIALLVAACLAQCLDRVKKRPALGIAGVVLAASLVATFAIQYQRYLSVAPEELTIRYKGGRQWVALREIGTEIRKRTKGWETRPTLFLWGWQSPLFFYGNLDSASRQGFADDLTRNVAGTNHPFIKPRVDRIMEELKAHPPDFVFTGYPPFPDLQKFLYTQGYRNSRFVPGLWVSPGHWAEFETGSPAS